MKLLEVSNVTSGYGELVVVKGVSFSVEKGEFLAIVGPNGAGKSTLLKTIAGVLKPRSGSIKFEGKDITHTRTYERVELGIALVPEGRGILTTLTVEENLQLGAYTGRAREKLGETLEWIYQLFPILKERRKVLADRLSGGEQQMLAIARALMSRPKLLMIDEMSQGLAPSIVKTLFNTIEEIRREVTLIVVEQRIQDVLKRADRGLVLEFGSIVLEGAGSELLNVDKIRKHYLGV